MLGCYDFCGHYEWTFHWLDREGGHELVRQYWDEAIHRDSQQQAKALISARGVAGMSEYWAHALTEEAAGYQCTATDDVFRIDMHECPSKGFLIRNGLNQYDDYCDHCMGWIGPMLGDVGWVVDHQHNHQGQCWWEIKARNNDAPASEPGQLSGPHDVRLRPTWPGSTVVDTYIRANDPDAKGSKP